MKLVVQILTVYFLGISTAFSIVTIYRHSIDKPIVGMKQDISMISDQYCITTEYWYKGDLTFYSTNFAGTRREIDSIGNAEKNRCARYVKETYGDTLNIIK